MSNKLWVTWKDSTGRHISAKVRGLQGNSDVDDLRKAFVEDRKLDIDSARVQVFVTQGGEKLAEDQELEPYFVKDTDNQDEKSQPGRSKQSALFLTLPIQQLEQPCVSSVFSTERFEKIAAFAEAQMDDRTKNKPMSEASADWAESILAAYGVKHDRLNKVVAGVGSLKDPPPFNWTIQTTQGETWKKGEHGGTPGALAWLKENFMVSNSPYDLKVVTGAKLPKVKGNRKSATGKTDILIGDAKDIYKGSTFDFAMGLVELKTNLYPLKVGQNLLELLSLSMASTFKKAVVLLATDCTTKWEVFFFSDSHTIQSQVYHHGSKAWDDLLQLLNSSSDRDYVDKKSLWVSSLPLLPEQNLAGFEVSDRDTKKAKAEEDETMLEHFADRMADLYGERPSVPWWARANARIPDYYG